MGRLPKVSSQTWRSTMFVTAVVHFAAATTIAAFLEAPFLSMFVGSLLAVFVIVIVMMIVAFVDFMTLVLVMVAALLIFLLLAMLFFMIGGVVVRFLLVAALLRLVSVMVLAGFLRTTVLVELVEELRLLLIFILRQNIESVVDSLLFRRKRIIKKMSFFTP